MPKLSSSEVSALLWTPIIARLATITPDNRPYVVPLWQYWDGHYLYVVPRSHSRFVDHIRSNNNVAVSCADDIDPSHRRLLIEGAAEIIEGPVLMSGRMLEIASEMAERYAGQAGLNYLDSTKNKPRYLVRIVASTITTWAGSWHPRYG